MPAPGPDRRAPGSALIGNPWARSKSRRASSVALPSAPSAFTEYPSWMSAFCAARIKRGPPASDSPRRKSAIGSGARLEAEVATAAGGRSDGGMGTDTGVETLRAAAGGVGVVAEPDGTGGANRAAGAKKGAGWR